MRFCAIGGTIFAVVVENRSVAEEVKSLEEDEGLKIQCRIHSLADFEQDNDVCREVFWAREMTRVGLYIIRSSYKAVVLGWQPRRAQEDGFM